MACASASPCVLARARAVAPRNAASRVTEPSSSGARGASPRSLGDRRAPWARAASGGVDVSLSSTLPALKPWAEAKVQKCAGAWEKAAALAPNPPIAVVDLVPDEPSSPDGALSGDVEPKKKKKKGPFETEFGAFIYDKGYRQLFRALGYPGADAEAALALERLNGCAAIVKPRDASTRVVLDVSCGPGIITTRIAAGLRGYDALVASDVSEAMTKRAAEQLDTLAATTQVLRAKSTRGDDDDEERDESSSAPLPAFAAVRADVCALPFADASVAAAHSSAGAHCWPDPPRGFAEIARVLKPGGVFVASTVVLAAPIRDKYVENGDAADARAYRDGVWDVNTPFWDADAVVEMVRESGLVDVEVLREDKCFVMIAARKR